MLGSVWWYMHLSIEISILACYVYSHLLEEEGRMPGVGDTLASLSAKEWWDNLLGKMLSLAEDLNTEGPFSTGCYNPKPLHCVWFNHVSPLFWPGSNYLICSLPELGRERLHAGVKTTDYCQLSTGISNSSLFNILEPDSFLNNTLHHVFWILDPFFNEIMFCFPSFKNSS